VGAGLGGCAAPVARPRPGRAWPWAGWALGCRLRCWAGWFGSARWFRWVRLFAWCGGSAGCGGSGEIS